MAFYCGGYSETLRASLGHNFVEQCSILLGEQDRLGFRIKQKESKFQQIAMINIIMK